MVKPRENGRRVAIGLDLGQAQDFTALAVLQRVDDQPEQPEPVFLVRRVERLPLGTSYPAVVEHVRALLRNLENRHEKGEISEEPDLVVDAMGVGMPVVDAFRGAGLDPIAVKVHGGSEETCSGGCYHVPKRDLVANLRLLYESRLVRAPETLPHLADLERELLAFRVKVSASGHDSYEAWREADHDDLVFALGLAAWWLLRRPRTIEFS